MPAPEQQDVTVETLNQQIWDHLEARDWHHNPARGLAISLALEAGELLEHYQWGDEPVGGREAVGEELADVLIYAVQIAQRNNIDIVDAIERKLEKAAEKYPADDLKGKTGAMHHEAWKKHKLAYKKTGL
ncbi:nucleotide pyrophosphohydrolase [Streptomyces caniscabiei]|uniref:nucleotide pyrophosphohydrolase n=1 Tax=Streptomyces caniscabiei TaxID=2746961 RepID=UPI0029A7CE30|nr:nucleotide pyrophosphohydrolase [Streptomyces caniscabiei]MDX2776103.1 nucleotide pyrophosphohydrolase [Streptomyces caniscabiei]